MAFNHAPLLEAELGPAVWNVVKPGAPAPLQGMVARGLAPLPPRDLVVALYQLWVCNLPQLAQQSAKTVEGLPLQIVTGALADARLPAGVLDFLTRKLPSNVDVLEGIVRHANVADDTLVGMSRLCPESICDLLAENQARWLACPAIVEALYQNPSCRMSVAQRMLELAVREGVELALPNIEEIKLAIASTRDEPPATAEDDEDFRRAASEAIASQERMAQRMREAGAAETVDLDAVVTGGDETLAGIQAALELSPSDDMQLPMDDGSEAKPEPPKEEPDPRADRVTQISKLTMMKKIRLALMGNGFERAVLIRDSNKVVCLSAIKSPRVKENEVVAYSANRSLSHDVVRHIAQRRDWTKLYAVKLNLVLNPKTPMASAMTLLGHLHAHDVRKVAHSKNIPSALATAAKRRMQQRR
ncbi:MAG: hypothetical protein K0V04_03030 [Deltaproteobacteria bacterium]|nr:hypothetical protein [Deltaproteobacteria bacterium]